MMQRRDEILAKKAKLAELRKQREEREQRQKEGRREPLLDDGSGIKVPTPHRSADRQELDNFIETLVGERAPSRSPAGTPARRSRPSSTLSQVQVGSETYEQAQSTSSAANYTTASTQTSTAGDTALEPEKPSAAPKPPVEFYNKGVQTSDEWSPSKQRRPSGSDSGIETSPSRSPTALKGLSRRQREREAELRESLRKEIEEELKAARDLTIDGKIALGPSKFPARALHAEELNAVTSSDDFLEFVERSSKVIEKALDQDYDVLADYALDGVGEVDEDEDEGYGSSRGRKGIRMKQVAQFWDERWSKKRMISDINFSPKYPELLLASYTKNVSAPQDPSGLVQVWNMHLHSRPEYIFHSTSDVLTAQFSPFHPSLIIGGSYTGQVQIWDSRNRSKLPVRKTPLTGASSGGHTHPIYSISVVGTQNANNIISCSTDGVVCGWTTDMLTVPQEYLELSTPPPSKTDDLSPTCMSFPLSDPTSFLVGTEEGTIYPCHRYDRAGAKAGVDQRQRYRGHTAPVMSLNFHPARGPIDLGDLVLSSSLDWTIRLWKTRPASSSTVGPATPVASTSTYTNPLASATASSSSTGSSQEQVVEPVLDITRDDLIYDARWSPQKPGVFACVDGAGSLEVWDLTLDTEVPVCKATPQQMQAQQGANNNTNSSSSGGGGGGGGGSFVAKGSLNRVAWEDKEGKRIAVGGASGVVTVFEVGSGLSAEGGVSSEEWARMKRLGSSNSSASRIGKAGA